MSAVMIPLTTQFPAFWQTVTLDNQRYRMQFVFSARDNHWLFHLHQDKPLLEGVKLVINYPLIGKYVAPELPQGELVLFDTSGTGKPCGRYDLGERCQLVYLPFSSLEQECE